MSNSDSHPKVAGKLPPFPCALKHNTWVAECATLLTASSLPAESGCSAESGLKAEQAVKAKDTAAHTKIAALKRFSDMPEILGSCKLGRIFVTPSILQSVASKHVCKTHSKCNLVAGAAIKLLHNQILHGSIQHDQLCQNPLKHNRLRARLQRTDRVGTNHACDRSNVQSR